MAILVQFLLRLSFGLAVGMAITSSRLVSSGYFRNHLYVTLGLATLAALVASQFSMIIAILAGAAAVFSYVAAVCWLYEAKRAGGALLWFVAGCSLAAALAGTLAATTQPNALQPISVVTSGLVLGLTLAAMLLGHWYLNSPGMELAPLRRLLMFVAAAVGAQMLVSAAGLVGELHVGGGTNVGWWMFVLLRWSFGLVGVLALIAMVWQTLRIPNTQSATGILYVAVIGTFVGELMALLLSAESVYPL
ncbi:MAG TPA: hypothetical protein VGM76_04850 [Lacipirellulaceae bacterium]|jgi:hypothetical protein